MDSLRKMSLLLIFGAIIINSQALTKENSRDAIKSVLISKIKDLLGGQDVGEPLRCGCMKKGSYRVNFNDEDDDDDFEDFTRQDGLRCGCGNNNNFEDSLRCGCGNNNNLEDVLRCGCGKNNNLQDGLRCGCGNNNNLEQGLRCGCGNNNNLEDSLRCGCGNNNNLEDVLRCGCGNNNNLEEGLRCGCGNNNNLEDSLRCGCGNNNNLEDGLRCGCSDSNFRSSVEELFTSRLKKRQENTKFNRLLTLLLENAVNRIDDNKKSDMSSSAAQLAMKALLENEQRINKQNPVLTKINEQHLDKTPRVKNTLYNNVKRLLQNSLKYKVNDDINAYVLNTLNPKDTLNRNVKVRQRDLKQKFDNDEPNQNIKDLDVWLKSKGRKDEQSLLDSFGAPTDISSNKRKRSVLIQNNALETETLNNNLLGYIIGSLDDLESLDSKTKRLDFIEKHLKDLKRGTKDNNNFIRQLINKLHTQYKLSKDVSVEVLDLEDLKRNTKKQNQYRDPKNSNKGKINTVGVKLNDNNKRGQSNTRVNRLDSILEMILDNKINHEKVDRINKNEIHKRVQSQNIHSTLNDLITDTISPKDFSNIIDDSKNDYSNRDENSIAILKIIKDLNNGQHSFKTISIDNFLNKGQESMNKIGRLYLEKDKDLKSLVSKQTHGQSDNSNLNDIMKHIAAAGRIRPNTKKYKPTITEQLKKNNLKKRIKLKIGRSENTKPEFWRRQNQETQYGVPFEMNLQLLGQVLD